MILIYNTIISKEPRDRFRDETMQFVGKNHQYEVIHVSDELPEVEKYSHLLISGSELSASAGSEWDEKIIELIKKFAEADKPILGICHGHQMIAQTFGAKCRRTAIPEFSWRAMEITDNPLFAGIENPCFLESHYDEVYDLTDDFNLIATSKECYVQGFQVKGHPIFGIQFHPEQTYAAGNKMVDDHIAESAQDLPYYRNDLKNPEQLDQNYLIFENFFRM